MATGPEVVRMLIARGLSPLHAAGLVGHSMQESSLNPAAYNPKEDAHGILQWRLDRLDSLRNFARSRGGSGVGDLDTQLDFIIKEMQGPEAKAGSAFFGAKDLGGVHDALKRYIRYGDASDAARLGNARALLGGAAPASGTLAGAAPFAIAPAADADVAPATSPGVARNPIQMAQQEPQQEELEPMRIDMAKPIGLARMRRLLAAMKGA